MTRSGASVSFVRPEVAHQDDVVVDRTPRKRQLLPVTRDVEPQNTVSFEICQRLRCASVDRLNNDIRDPVPGIDISDPFSIRCPVQWVVERRWQIEFFGYGTIDRSDAQPKG